MLAVDRGGRKGYNGSMDKRESQPKKRRRPLPLIGTRFWPLLQALLVLLLLGGGAYAFVRLALPALMAASDRPADLSCLGIYTPAPPTPVPSPPPSPTPQPGTERSLYGLDLGRVQHEIMIPEFQYASDFSVWKDTILFVAGNYTPDGTAAFTRVILYDTKAQHATHLPLALNYRSIRHPQLNDRWIVYLDALASGGGQIRAYNIKTAENRILKTVHLGLPVLALWEDTVFWVERTGSSRDKLFGCDLVTGESVTLELFDSTDAGISAASAGGGKLAYVSGPGSLKILDLATGETREEHYGFTVHDPKTDGKIVAFLTGYHGEDSALMLVDEKGQLITVAQGVADFALADGAIVYGELDRTYVYFLDDGATFCLTRPSESAMFLGAGEDYAIWMDVTWRDRDIIEYMHLNDFSADLIVTEEP